MKRLFLNPMTVVLLSLVTVFPLSSMLDAQDKTKSAQTDKDLQDEEDTDERTDEDKPDDEENPDDEKKKTATVDVEIKSIVVYQSFDGVFESTRTHEVTTDFKTWKDLKIESVVEEGAAVSTGQELLKFETDSIEKAVAEAEFAASNSAFDLENAQLDMKQINETFDLDNAIAERAWKNAQQDHDYYKSIQLPQRIDDIDYSEKTAGYFLEYTTDELDQLEQMYTEDELTEESEEIVLKRARRSVESAERSKKRAMRRVGRDREINVPRETIGMDESLKRAEMVHQRSTITLPIKKKKTEVALAQAEFGFKNKVKHLEEIQADQKLMALIAPADGVLYYGRCIRGKWVGAQGAGARRLKPHKKVSPNGVVMTIVDIGQMMVRANLDEAKLDSLAPRMRGQALIKSAGNKTIPAMIKSVSRIPLDDGKFDCQIVVENLPNDGSVMPGMGCKLSFLVHENKQATVVPKASVFSDDNGVSHYVYVMDGEKPMRKAVTVGHTAGDDIEITDGLAAGDKIAKSKP